MKLKCMLYKNRDKSSSDISVRDTTKPFRFLHCHSELRIFVDLFVNKALFTIKSIQYFFLLYFFGIIGFTPAQIIDV